MNCPRCQTLMDNDSSVCSSCGYNHATALLATLPALPPSGPIIDPLIDMELDHKYKLTKLLGRGGMGSVYRARRLRFAGGDVAIKVLHKQVIDEDIRKRFQREASAAARLSRHRNIVIIHDFEDGTNEQALAYIVMELLEGKALNEILREETKLEPARAVWLMRETCEGVQYAHEQNVIHRDLKPHNIVILPVLSGGQKETVKIVDFGLAKLRSTQMSSLSDSLTPPGTLLGTPVYMSPEACRGDVLDVRSDIYSLGATMYHMLTGRPPFLADNILELQWKHVHEKPPSFPANGTSVHALETVVMQALEKDPAKRQQDARSFAQQLKDALKKGVVPTLDISVPTLTEFSFDVARVAATGQLVERTRGKAKYFRERIGDELLDLVEIPGGRFVMGSPEHEADRHNDEGPQREVTVKTFYMSKYEITQAQWRAIAVTEKINRDLPLFPSYFRGDRKPVERVSWLEAVEFCQRLSRQTGRTYRLPTEAEWEYACRSGLQTPFCCGENICDEVVNYNASYPYGSAPRTQGRSTTTAVGSLGFANNFGLFDMLGNVWEWCEDVYRPSYEGTPTDGSACVGGDYMPRVIRGGSWRAAAGDCGSAARNSSAPQAHEDDIGFRIVCSSTQIVERVPSPPVPEPIHRTDPQPIPPPPIPEPLPPPEEVKPLEPKPPEEVKPPEPKPEEVTPPQPKPEELATPEPVPLPEPVSPLRRLRKQISDITSTPIPDRFGLALLDPTKPVRVLPFLILTHVLIALFTIDMFVPSIFQSVLEPALWGLVLAIVQVLVLRWYLRGPIWWIVLTMAAAMASGLIYYLTGLPWDLTWSYFYWNSAPQNSLLDRWTTIGAVVTLRWIIIAIVQWLMRRRLVTASSLWPLAIIAASVLCGLLIGSLPRLHDYQVFAIYVSSVAVFVGLAQGFCLLRFQKRSP